MENMDSNLSRMHPLAESTLIGSDEMRNSSKRKTLSPLLNSSNSRLRMSQLSIDPSVLTNAQSKGIVKRLISYHEESQNNEMNRNNRYVYNRVGDFPIVHLKKTELKRNLVRSSSVRIAPPSKLTFNREARAAILRSNSFQMSNFGLNSSGQKLTPVRMKAQDSPHQIITNHDPISLDEPPQTSKSVLEALEKNCRKRINIEELIMDRTKRVCQPNAPLQPEFDVPLMSSQKRARASPEKSTTDSPIAPQIKRSKIKSNALLSSLSSSHYSLIPRNGYSAKYLQQSKVVNPVIEKKVVEDPVAMKQPISSEPKNIQQQSPGVKKLRLFNVAAKLPPPSFKLKNRNFNESVDDDDDDEFKVNFVKPKEKPSNIDLDAIQSVEKEKLSRMLHCLGDGLSKTTSEYPSKDTVDANKSEATATKKAVSFAASISFTTTTTSSNSLPITTPSSSSLSSVENTKSISTASVPSIVTPLIPITPIKPIENEKPSETKETEKPELSKEAEKAAEKVEPKLPTVNFSIPTTVEKPTEKPAGISFGSFTSNVTTSSASAAVSPLKTVLPSLDAGKSLISFSPAPEKKETTITKPTSPVAPVLGGFSFSANKDTTSSTLPSFQFGVTSTASTAVTTSSVTTSTSGLFGFSSTNSSISTSSASTAPTFNFGGVKPVENPVTTAQPTISFTQTPVTTASGIGFSFGGSANAAPVATTASPGFSFGGIKPSTTSTPAAPAAGGFSFGTSSATVKSPTFEGFGPQTSSSTNPIGIFQTTSTTSTIPSISNNSAGSGIFNRLGDKQSDTNATPSFQFGAPKTDQKPSGISFGNDNKQPEMKMFSFGGEKKLEAPAAPTFGSQQPEINKLPGFSFNAQKQPENKPTFSFGGNVEKPIEKSTFSFGEKPAEQKPSFNFGGGNMEKPAEPAPAFNFSSVKPQEPSKSAFNFGGNSDAVKQPTPVFGSNSTTNSSIFGAAVKPFTAKQDEPVSFGSISSPFGQSTNPSVTPTFGASTQPAPPTFGANNNNSSGGSLFGSNNMSTFNQNTSSFKPANTFGGASQQNSTSSGGMFNFNANNKPSMGPSQTPQSPPSAGVFSFGNNNSNTQQATSSNIFGGGNSGQNVSASFSFKPATGVVSPNTSNNVFNSNQNSSQSAYQFGQGVTNASASFTFSPSSATSGSSQQPPSFNFNGPQSAPVVPNAFNFQAQQQQPQMGMQNAGGQNTGFFTIGVGGGQQKRPFRQATRRLK